MVSFSFACRLGPTALLATPQAVKRPKYLYRVTLIRRFRLSLLRRWRLAPGRQSARRHRPVQFSVATVSRNLHGRTRRESAKQSIDEDREGEAIRVSAPAEERKSEGHGLVLAPKPGG